MERKARRAVSTAGKCILLSKIRIDRFRDSLYTLGNKKRASVRRL